MTQPEVTPPGNTPLFEGLGSEWNDVLSALPEDKRSLYGSAIRDRISSYEPLKAYEDFHKSGVSADQIGMALQVLSTVENNPREVYEAIGKHLGISTAEVKQVAEEIKKEESSNLSPEYQQLQQQFNTMAQIMLAQRQEQEKSAAQQREDRELEQAISELKKKHGDFPEDEVLMRAIHKELSLEDAYKDYEAFVTQTRQTRPAPTLLGSGGSIPRQPLDVKSLDSAGTKNIVAQMLEHANRERNQG